jgi:hypothetical protein
MGKHFIPIWFFIGSLLTIYGVLIVGSGIYELFEPPRIAVAMSSLHIGIWWGCGILLVGLAYVFRFRPNRNDVGTGSDSLRK